MICYAVKLSTIWCMELEDQLHWWQVPRSPSLSSWHLLWSTRADCCKHSMASSHSLRMRSTPSCWPSETHPACDGSYSDKSLGAPHPPHHLTRGYAGARCRCGLKIRGGSAGPLRILDCWRNLEIHLQNDVDELPQWSYLNFLAFFLN